jgi:hypothetical protein
LTGFEPARTRMNAEPRIGRCYPKASYEEYQALVAINADIQPCLVQIATEQRATQSESNGYRKEPTSLASPPAAPEAGNHAAPAGPPFAPSPPRTDASDATGEKEGEGSDALPGADERVDPRDSGGHTILPATPQRRRRSKPGDARELIIAALDSLAAEGNWGAREADIRERAGVARSTYSDVMKKDDKAQRARAMYRAQGRGRGPARPRDL